MIKEFLTGNRMKSLYWRTGMMFVASFCNILGDGLVGFRLTPEVTIFFGLLLGEISKGIANSLSIK